jgi:hypothetical protein
MHPGAAGCTGRIIARLSDRRTAGTAAARHAPDFRIIGRATRPTWQPAALVARDASRPGDRCPRGRQLARQPRGTPPGRCAAGRGRRASQPPTGRRSWPGLRHGWADPYRQPPTSGVASRRPAPAEVFSMVRNPLPTSWTPGFRCAMSRKRRRMRIRGRRCGMTGPAPAWTGTLPTSSPPTSQAPLGEPGPLDVRPGGRGRQDEQARGSTPGDDHLPLPKREPEPPNCS